MQKLVTLGHQRMLVAADAQVFVYEGKEYPLEAASDVQEVTDQAEICTGCDGTGEFFSANKGRITGPCYRCGGKAFQDDQDRRRNAAWDRHHQTKYLSPEETEAWLKDNPATRASLEYYQRWEDENPPIDSDDL